MYLNDLEQYTPGTSVSDTEYLNLVQGYVIISHEGVLKVIVYRWQIWMAT